MPDPGSALKPARAARRPAEVVAFPTGRTSPGVAPAEDSLAHAARALHDALETLLIAEEIAPTPGPVRDLALMRARSAFEAARAKHPFLAEDVG